MAKTDSTSQYPEHDKLLAVKDESQALGEFLDMSKFTLCTLKVAGNNGEPKWRWVEGVDREGEPDAGDSFARRAEDNPAYESWSDHWTPTTMAIQDILADWFGIDQDKIEAEKRQMLDEIRAANAA